MPATLTTGSSVPLTGATIPATAIDQADSQVQLQFDITNHLDGNTAALQAFVDLSQDGGVTFTRLLGCGRSAGQTNGNTGLAFVASPLPGVGNANRQIRASLLASQSVTTSMQLVIT